MGATCQYITRHAVATFEDDCCALQSVGVTGVPGKYPRHGNHHNGLLPCGGMPRQPISCSQGQDMDSVHIKLYCKNTFKQRCISCPEPVFYCTWWLISKWGTALMLDFHLTTVSAWFVALMRVLRANSTTTYRAKMTLPLYVLDYLENSPLDVQLLCKC